MHVTFDPQDFWVNTPKQGMEQVSEGTEVSNHFLESCHIKEKAFYSSLGHSSIPVSSLVHQFQTAQNLCLGWMK